jgi:hypothetical protein
MRRNTRIINSFNTYCAKIVLLYVLLFDIFYSIISQKLTLVMFFVVN